MTDHKLRDYIQSRIPGLFSIITAFVIIEAIIVVVCLVYATDKDVVKIYNSKNEIIYDDRYNSVNIAEFKRIYGIKSFKGEGYTIKRFGIDNKFPTRAWIALSICIPMVLVMFFVFIVKVFNEIFQSKPSENEKNGKESKTSDFDSNRFEKLFSTLEKLNTYSLGFAVIMLVFLYWVIPDLLIYVSKVSYQTVAELKWVILGLVVFAGAFIILKVVLSHKTKTEIIKQQADIQKHRDLLAIEQKLEKENALLVEKSSMNKE